MASIDLSVAAAVRLEEFCQLTGIEEAVSYETNGDPVLLSGYVEGYCLRVRWNEAVGAYILQFAQSHEHPLKYLITHKVSPEALQSYLSEE